MTKVKEHKKGRFAQTTLMGLIAFIILVILFALLFTIESWVYYTYIFEGY